MKHFRRPLMIRSPPGIRRRAEDKFAREAEGGPEEGRRGGSRAREQKYFGGGDKIARLVLN